ncbi:siderophore-interacting protein [Actinosynnema sp. NPDC020468]|uniref:siderophore-interacting protein n=1 Tax=Actinosynnema sp. NPDC020468 TaxID=3154488 RepID=UPI0033E5366E
MPLLHVHQVHALTPHLTRITFTGPGLDDFPTWPDQQLKLLFPRAGHPVPDLPTEIGDRWGMAWYEAYQSLPDDERPWLRSFTVRAHHADTHRLDVDFVLHDRGPASDWARAARPGDVIGRYGPSKVYARPLPRGDWHLFAGDETALPAIASILETLPADVPAFVFAEVRDAGEELPLSSPAALTTRWVHRPTPGVGGLLLDAVRAALLPEGAGAAWVAGESATVRALRRHLVDERGLPKRQVEFAGYWRRALTQDDAPTPEDLAEAQERLDW